MITREYGNELSTLEMNDLGITSMMNNGVHMIYFQGDEPPREPPVIAPVLNWKGLSQGLFYSPLYPKTLIEASPNAFSTLLKVLTDGENGYASENAFLMVFNLLNVEYTQQEKDQINEILSTNNFTITV